MNVYTSKQEIFDASVRGLRVQGFQPSLAASAEPLYPGDTGDCAYRGDEGRKCIIGQLIPDEKYYPGMESTMTPLHLELAMAAAEIPANFRRFCTRLQWAHDNSITPNDMILALRHAAAEEGLDASAIDAG